MLVAKAIERRSRRLANASVYAMEEKAANEMLRDWIFAPQKFIIITETCSWMTNWSSVYEGTECSCLSEDKCRRRCCLGR